MNFTKKLKFFTSKLFFDDTELPAPNSCLFLYDKKNILPRVLKMWHDEEPLYFCTYNTNQENIDALQKTGKIIGKIIVHELFKGKIAIPENMPHEWSDNHAKIYICSPYVLFSSCNFSRNASMEFFLFINNEEVAKVATKLIFGVSNEK